MKQMKHCVPQVSTDDNSMYECNACEYFTTRSNDYQKHCFTRKHRLKEVALKRQQSAKSSALEQEELDEDLEEVVEEAAEGNLHECFCGELFYSRTTLWRHKKAKHPNNKKPSYHDYFESTAELVQTVLQSNQELKQLLVEQSAKMMELAANSSNNICMNSNNNNVTNTTNNNQFNLQMYLNVECKDALNISEFIDMLQPKFEDLEATGRLGYVEGVSRIMINGLQSMYVNKRPIHCSDQKRETIYIKDNGVWEKDVGNKKLTNAIKQVALKNIQQIIPWQQANPGCCKSSSKKNDQYLNIVSNSMNGLTEEEANRNYEKIVSKVAKEVVIDKRAMKQGSIH